jgi:hypothetical protein
MMMPLVSANSAAGLVDGDADVADARGQIRADHLHRACSNVMFSSCSPTSALAAGV